MKKSKNTISSWLDQHGDPKIKKNVERNVILDLESDGQIIAQKPPLLWAVLKLSQDIIYTDPFTREERKEKIKGIAGFIPCYETYEEAEEAACDGKFQIMAIKPA
jgi:hypothetical protein